MHSKQVHPLLKPQPNHTYRWDGWRLRGTSRAIDAPERGYFLDLSDLRHDAAGTVAHVTGKSWGVAALSGLLGAIRDLAGHEVDPVAACKARYGESLVHGQFRPTPARIFCERRCAIDHADHCQRCAAERSPHDARPDLPWCRACRCQFVTWRRGDMP